MFRRLDEAMEHIAELEAEKQRLRERKACDAGDGPKWTLLLTAYRPVARVELRCDRPAQWNGYNGWYDFYQVDDLW